MTPNELVLTFRGSYICANFGENPSRNATVRVLTDRQTHRQTDRQTQTDFIICPMLFAIAIGQITSSSAVAERPPCRVGQFLPKVQPIFCRQYRSIFNHCDVKAHNRPAKLSNSVK